MYSKVANLSPESNPQVGFLTCFEKGQESGHRDMSEDWLCARSTSHFPGLGCEWQHQGLDLPGAPICGLIQAPLRAPDPKGAYTCARVIRIPPLPSYIM